MNITVQCDLTSAATLIPQPPASGIIETAVCTPRIEHVCMRPCSVFHYCALTTPAYCRVCDKSIAAALHESMIVCMPSIVFTTWSGNPPADALCALRPTTGHLCWLTYCIPHSGPCVLDSPIVKDGCWGLWNGWYAHTDLPPHQ